MLGRRTWTGIGSVQPWLPCCLFPSLCTANTYSQLFMGLGDVHVRRDHPYSNPFTCTCFSVTKWYFSSFISWLYAELELEFAVKFVWPKCILRIGLHAFHSRLSYLPFMIATTAHNHTCHSSSQGICNMVILSLTYLLDRIIICS